MLSVIIQDSGEENVVRLTYENLWRELKDIEGAELKVYKNWFDALGETKNKYICFVEADCLVQSGYFASMLGLFKKEHYFRKLAMLSPTVGVNNWANKFYGYQLGDKEVDGVIPIREKKSNSVYPVQIGYVPGAIIRVTMLHKFLRENKPDLAWDNLVGLSTRLSLGFWKQGDGNRVHVNPNTTYVTTEDYVNDIQHFTIQPEKLLKMFAQEVI